MSTKAQRLKLAKPLIARVGDVELVGHYLVLRPVHHVLRGVLIDRRRGAPEPWPVMFVRHLFEEQTWLTHHWGRELVPQKPKMWRWSEPDEIEDLRQRLETEVFPHLRRIQTLDDMLVEVARVWPGAKLFPVERRTEIIRSRPCAQLAFDVALGQLEQARTHAEHYLRVYNESNYGLRDEEDLAEFRRFSDFCRRILADDRRSLVALLHEWEAATVRHFKMEHIWEPTPFPIETMGLVD